VDSIGEPKTGGEDIERGEEVSGEFVESGCETAQVLQAAEKALDDAAQAIEPSVMVLLAFGRFDPHVLSVSIRRVCRRPIKS
jgi:hypothetical protein